MRAQSLQGVKKPYNPIIGETFAAAWRHEDGSISQYVAEQVLHRPPVTALYFENRQRGIVINGQVHTRYVVASSGEGDAWQGSSHVTLLLLTALATLLQVQVLGASNCHEHS